MGNHDTYGKAVLREAAGSAFRDSGTAVCISYGDKGGATIDGVVGESIAVEIESRVSKQVPGAVFDLICHKYPMKPWVLLPVHMSNPSLWADQCRNILGRFVQPQDSCVVVPTGSCASDALQVDLQLISTALHQLGYETTP